MFRLGLSAGWLIAGLLAGILALPGAAFGQFNRTNRTGTTGSSLSFSAMRSSASQGLFGTRTFGQGMSARTGTSSGLGLSSAFSSRLMTSQQQTRQMQAGRQQGQFVGADTGDVRNILGFVTNPNQAVQAWRQGLTSLRSAFGQQPNQPSQPGSFGGRGTTRSGRIAEVPAVVEAGFQYEPPAPPSVASTLQTRLEKAGLPGVGSSVQVAVEGDVVVLRGSVSSSHQRLLAENLARLEPGVRQVRNELVVEPSASESARP
ncbi:MAG: BON domain-containing protein [Thermoguttaceae bacterium]|nr:BON domain-containing protein [Thermoguttaceae bacterium]MDW8078917.1 BON domain-containing protein [Thermoguttaceae bacterium]